MPKYQITPEIKARAKKLEIEVKPSSNPKKKLDAYSKDGKIIASFGGNGYMDYHLYKKEYGNEVAEQKRKQYKKRHEKDRKVKYRDGKLTAGYLADKILW
jgi:hypothetical protein